MGEGHTFGDPDDAEHSKARALIEYAAWFKRKALAPAGQRDGTMRDISFENIEIFWWIDWACTDQDNPGPDMAALPAYAAVCAGMVAAWSDEYAGRAWVRRHSPLQRPSHTHTHSGASPAERRTCPAVCAVRSARSRCSCRTPSSRACARAR
mgnify:CR=1 FL=1